MRTQPPSSLVHLLGRLKLATPEEVVAVARHAGRLAGDLPDFESVWVDALAQARVLTPFQAAQINAGRGESLSHGPYVSMHPLGSPHWAECYAARHAETGRIVRLYVVERVQDPTAATVEALAALLARSAPLRDEAWPVVEDFGTSGPLAWAACATVEATSAADWMVENGRFPPNAALHIAREMAYRLAELEEQDILHGDVCAAGLLLQAGGHVALPAPGLRAIVRPYEGYSFNDLRPEAYDYLAPERIADRGLPTTASDVYACGCLWWHLLTGRAPFPGGDSLARLKAAHAARLVDVRQLAPEAPAVLVDAIDACLAREPAERPASFAALCERLGPPTRGGSSLLAGLVSSPSSSWQVVRSANHRKRRASRQTRWLESAAAIGVALLAALVPYLLLGRSERAQTAGVEPAKSPAAQAAPELVATPQRPPVAPVIRPPRVDPAVKPATATDPLDVSTSRDVVLPTDDVLRIEQLALEPHARVRGLAGRRATVVVPRRGLVVPCDDVTFERIDFVWEDGPASARSARLYSGAMIEVQTQSAHFEGCSFAASGEAPPAAISFVGPDDSAVGLAGEVTLRNCVCQHLTAVIDGQSAGGLAATLENALCVDTGPIVRLHRAPRADAPVALVLDHVTLRGAGSAVECRYRHVDENPGRIAVTADGSALAGDPGTALIVLAGSEPPDGLAAALVWTGHGSIVTPRVDMVSWRSGRGEQTLPEENLEIDGLVRSELEFAGDADGPPAASCVTRWQVPLRSPEPPGANTALLSPPR